MSDYCWNGECSGASLDGSGPVLCEGHQLRADLLAERDKTERWKAAFSEELQAERQKREQLEASIEFALTMLGAGGARTALTFALRRALNP